ncbi:MAG: dihydropteroate synthase [Dissulfurimicrobium sp.]|uniref:dihydropteroate synthase n=1 Tax=Dissulfurimicrobium hydrothermale TaxID=1750598 RepID=UPI001EDA08C2|nr:dihydropteroate synthase [Dissulfurimicrobium hydrothermale]UKL12896.1 dihydropteroate synthase [Dissulfurimicrobium hydrothermale]
MAHKKMTLKDMVIRGHVFCWDNGPYIMGIINVTPDSFSDGGHFLELDDAIMQAERLIEEGADILDIGGESTRPFSEPVSAEEEIRRVIPVIKAVRQATDRPISIDTTKALVAKAALEHGADIINDISALRFEPVMAEIASSFKAKVILMHMKGTPKDMQVKPCYDDVIGEVRSFLEKRISWAVLHGIPKEDILIDPGIGFGKDVAHNLTLINRLQEFEELSAPIVVGPSRKAFLGAITGIKTPYERDIPTLGAVAVAAVRGAHILRVHNVKNARQVLSVVNAIYQEKPTDGCQ